MSAVVAEPRPVQVRRSRASAAIAERLRTEASGAWAGVPYEQRLATAKRLLFVRLRLNRAGLMRWRREDRTRGR